MQFRATATILAVLALGCAPKGSYDGKLMDPVTGKTAAGVVVVASSTTTPTPSCMEIEATTGEDGAFRIEGLCGSGEYHLALRDKTLILEDVGAIQGGIPATGTVDLDLWKNAPGEGIWTWSGGEFSKMRTIAEIGVDKIWNTEEEVVYPDTLPTRVVNVGGDGWLVFAGEKFTERYTFLPLIESGARKLGSSKEMHRSEPWWYVGTEFASDTEFTRKDAQIDASKVKALTQGDTHLRFMRGDAVPNGFYVMYYEGFRDDPRYKKMLMVNMGAALKAPGAE